MGFRYPLQKIVDLKSNERTQAEWVLSEALAAFSGLQTSLHRLMEEREQWADKIAEAAEASTPIAQLQLMYRHLDHLDQQIMRKTEELSQASKRVEQCQEALGMKMAAEKMWLSEKDKAYIQYKKEQDKRDQQAVDELVNARFQRSEAR